MNFKNKLKIINEILDNSPYQTQKNKIEEIFNKTNSNKREDIILRLIIIDSCYSTNMNRRLFGFEELSDLILKFHLELTKNINIENFVKNNWDLLISNIGIDKKGNPKGHAFSLITKYIYFETKFNFPIYDSLVLDGLIKQKLINKTKKPSIKYFDQLIKIKVKEKISFDELDKYFWVIGKIRSGSPSLLISDSNIYKNNFLNIIISEKEKNNINSIELNKLISKKLKENNFYFKNNKLQLIQKLAKEIEINNL